MSRLKCNGCNIVINELLCFVQNKIDVMNNVSPALLCKQAFSEEEITEAKSLLFDSVKQRRIKRRGDEGKNKNVEDIIGLLKGAEPEIFPTFVAQNLHKLPPVTFDHVDVTRLLKDITTMQREISHLNEKCASFQELYVTKNDFKQEIESHFKVSNNEPQRYSLKHSYVNYKRGGSCLHGSPECNSGPMGLMTLRAQSDSPSVMEQKLLDDRLSLSRTSAVAAGTGISVPVAPAQWAEPAQVTQAHVEAPGLTTAVSNNDLHTSTEAPVRSADAVMSCQAISEMQRADAEQNKNAGEWIHVQRRKKSRFKGTKGTAVVNVAERFKAADVQIPLYIYNVSKEVTERDVANYVLEKTNVTIMPERVDVVKSEKDYTSFKFFIPRSKLALFNNNELWPEGIYFRRYIMFRKGKKTSALLEGDKKEKH